jgi:hypothetical protein
MPVVDAAPAPDPEAGGDAPVAVYKPPPPPPPLPAVQLIEVGEQPKRQAFDNPDAYDAALIAHGTRRGFRQQQEQAIQHASAARVAASWASAKAAAMKVVPDFAEVAERDDVQISEPMAMTIAHTENGPAVAYHLGKNPTEAARIARLPPAMQVYEIGRLAERTKLTAPRRAQPQQQTPREETMDQYAARRSKELAAARRPGAR